MEKNTVSDMEPNIKETLIGMKVQILPKQSEIPHYDSNIIQIKHILDYDSGEEWEADDITEEVITDLLNKIQFGVDIYLYLDPYGEVDCFEVVSDGEWIALSFQSNAGKDEDNYYSYNPTYANVEEFLPFESGGQSPIEKYLALHDIKLGIKAVEYFIYTGKLYPCIDWARQLD